MIPNSLENNKLHERLCPFYKMVELHPWQMIYIISELCRLFCGEEWGEKEIWHLRTTEVAKHSPPPRLWLGSVNKQMPGNKSTEQNVPSCPRKLKVVRSS